MIEIIGLVIAYLLEEMKKHVIVCSIKLENMYDSKKKMNLEMKDPVKFSQSMISAKTGCN